ncbi:NmrA family NAD(P)-binding protein [Mycobacterium sp. 94-17]|uniref:NmrA family NAD(P)-binding protein n=1 Tax=Mycobacterium sp. 94-17 TaxID=2986147 RepID=UPI002D1EC57B|nr:NmrA family NAD(P)-binding protein [Mycobacterium sp. 94-17]MEB4209529.1 NmrA family NAD(P)-binding protein [Mycobacterium sp. 94-17]
MKKIHLLSVLHNSMSVKIIEALIECRDDWLMNNIEKPVLVLGATGKTGSRVATGLADQGVAVRTASRHGSQVRFDWDDHTTYARALAGTRAVYLIPPVMRMDFAGIVSDFLDQAERAGVGHVTFLSAYGMQHASAELGLRAVELDLLDRSALTHSFIRPAWFMQNFSESFLAPVDDTIVVPNADGAEAYVAVEDIANVAAATLADPVAHAGAAYAPTGPEALNVTQAAEIISEATGRPITYCAIDQDAWIEAMSAAGVPHDYTVILRLLTSTVAGGNGSRPNEDVRAVTGRAPISFEEFATHTADTWK